MAGSVHIMTYTSMARCRAMTPAIYVERVKGLRDVVMVVCVVVQ